MRTTPLAPDDLVRHRFRVVVVSVLLTALAFVQAPGRIVADTKLDLVVDPGGFLARAGEMWDPQGFFGQLQNQAYGYLFPMGPFFWLGHALSLDPWVVQRLWWALLWVVAFVGVVRLCAALGVGGPNARIAAGVVFALSPRILTLTGPSSIEAWPSALAPWVLLPLVLAAQQGSVRRRAAASALAVAVVGGVNAVATFAVVPLAGLWILVGTAGERRRRLLLWWPPLVLLACAWWIVPLLLQGRYSPPFLDFIESASITTRAGTVFDALRGTSHWVPFVADAAQAGRGYLLDPALIVNAGALVLIGLAGLALPGLPHRRFLVIGVLGGLVLLTLGHTGPVQGWGSLQLQHLLDGALSPLRNTHKFDPLVRLPLAVGVAHAVTVLSRRGADQRESTLRRAAVATVAVAAVVGATVPAWSAQVPYRESSFVEVPGYWHETADWLDGRPGTALVVQASAFADYLWGAPGDEPLQPLAQSAWAVRNSIPLTPAATIRMLDSITGTLDGGEGSDALAPALRRAGVNYLVVRSDLRPSVGGGRGEATWRTARESAGLDLVAQLGPTTGGRALVDLESERTFANGGWQGSHRAVEIYAVASGGAGGAASAVPTVVGSADSLVPLDEAGVLDGGPVVLAQDASAEAEGPLVVTDGFRRQEYAFGLVHAGRSATLTPGEPYSLDRPVHDYVRGDELDWRTQARLDGAVSLSASSSRSSAAAQGGPRPEHSAWAAFDGDTRSAWEATGARGELLLRLTRPTDLGMVRVTTGQAPGVEQVVEVLTDDGWRRQGVVGDEVASLDVGTVSELRVRVLSATGTRARVAEVSSPALDVRRPLVLPRTDAAWGAPRDVVLGVDQPRSPSCLEVAWVARCRADVGDRGEDAYVVDRELRLGAGGVYRPVVTTSPLAGPALDRVLQAPMDVSVRASSAISDDPRSSVTGALDGDLATGWIADPQDTDPTLELEWDEPQTFSELRLRTARSLPASTVSSISLVLADGTQTAVGVEDGVARFDEVTTRSLRIRLGSAGDAYDFDGGGALRTTLPVGLSELEVPGADWGTPRSGDSPVRMRCGSGPTITVDGSVVQTAVTASVDDVRAGRRVTASPCSDGTTVALGSGSTRVTVRASEMFEAGTVRLQRVDATGALAEDAVGTDGPRVLATGHNVNPGWSATLGGTTLRPVTLNGWEQGWELPAGADARDLQETFAPGGTYRTGLLGGALALLLVIALAVWPPRRSSPPPAPSSVGSGPPATVLVGGGLLAVGLVGGTALVLAALVGVVVTRVAQGRRLPPAVVVAAPATLTLLVYTALPFGTTQEWVGLSTVPQLLVGVSLGALLSALGQDQDLSRRNGSST